MTPIKLVSAVASALIALAAPSLASAATDAEAIADTVGKYFAAIDKGAIPAAQAMQTADADIIDEFPPYHWRGTDALAAWFKDFGPFAQAGAISEPALKLDPAPRIEVTGERAYAVYSATFVYKAKGAPARQPGMLTLAMVKSGGAWRIQAWAWGSRQP